MDAPFRYPLCRALRVAVMSLARKNAVARLLAPILSETYAPKVRTAVDRTPTPIAIKRTAPRDLMLGSIPLSELTLGYGWLIQGEYSTVIYYRFWPIRDAKGRWYPTAKSWDRDCRKT